MFYFMLKISIYFIFIMLLYYHFSKQFRILDFIELLFIFNIYIILLYQDLNIIIGVIMTIIIFLLRKLFDNLYNIKNNKMTTDNILINRGNINFKALINNKYSFNHLIKEIHKRGIKDLNKIDYCALYQNQLLIFCSEFNSYPVSLIIDGRIIKDNLLNINKSFKWLEAIINKNNLLLKDINYAFYKGNKVYFLTNNML